MIIVGLTGNFGMGKSTACNIFKSIGAFIIDSDNIVRTLFNEPIVIEEVKNLFGDKIINQGFIDKKIISNLVFENPNLRIMLEDILHPKVFDKIKEEIRKFSKNTPAIIIIEAPVIFERGYQNKFDKILTVFTSEEIALNRQLQKGFSYQEIIKRLNSQFPINLKIEKSDFVIDNNNDLEQTKAQVLKIYHQLLSLEGKHENN